MTDALEDLLNVFWLRPETALFRSIDIRAMEDFAFVSPSLDLGCGDGIFSFIRAGGKFSPSFDAFQSMANMGLFFQKFDVFDSSRKISPTVIRRPNYLIDFALDHKKNLLSKAAALGLYRNLRIGDADKGLPFPDDTFNSIFSNIVYWLKDPAKAFAEIARVLKPGGRCCVMLPNRTFPEFSFYYRMVMQKRRKEFRFLEKLDRGRLADNIKQAKSAEEWTKLAASSGLRVVSHKAHLSKTVIEIWDIGLRPLFPVLHKMASNLDRKTAATLKREWIKTMMLFLDPISKMDSRLTQGMEPAFHCFIFEKQKSISSIRRRT